MTTTLWVVVGVVLAVVIAGLFLGLRIVRAVLVALRHQRSS